MRKSCMTNIENRFDDNEDDGDEFGDDSFYSTDWLELT